MPYSSTGLFKVAGGIGPGPAVWVYRSADVHTDVDAPNYFTDAVKRGMRVGDVVHVQETDNNYATTTHSVSAIAAGGAGTVSPAVLA